MNRNGRSSRDVAGGRTKLASSYDMPNGGAVKRETAGE